jgi:hypothetical protein
MLFGTGYEEIPTVFAPQVEFCLFVTRENRRFSEKLLFSYRQLME